MCSALAKKIMVALHLDNLCKKMGCIGDNTMDGSLDDDNFVILKNLACVEKCECVVEVLH